MTTAATVHVPAGTLRWARERAAASVEEAALRCEREADEVAEWEDGRSDPPLAVLRQLATFYGVPLSAFLLSRPPSSRLPAVDRRVYPGVQHPATSLELAKALHRASALQTVAHDLLEEAGAPRFGRLPGGDDRPDVLADHHRATLGISVATQLRWRDDGAAFRAWRSAVEGRAVFVLQAPMPDADVRAFSLPGDPPFIVLNRSDHVRARIFSLMHEYAHILLGQGGICKPGTGRVAMLAEPERYCNRFAGAVLVPADALRRDGEARQIAGTEAVPEDEILDRIARRFHVSRGVVWYRLHEVGFVPRVTFNAKWDEWGDWYPPRPPGGGPSTTAENVVRDYGATFPELLLSASRRGSLTKADVAEYLMVSAGSLASIEAAVSDRLAG